MKMFWRSDQPIGENNHLVYVHRKGATRACPAASAYRINHGAGRLFGRRLAQKTLDASEVNQAFLDTDILTNCRNYPLDEAPADD